MEKLLEMMDGINPQEEKRKKVAAALEAQAKAIDPKVKKTDDDQGDEGDAGEGDEEPGGEA